MSLRSDANFLKFQSAPSRVATAEPCRAHYHYRYIHQIHSILLRTCNFINETGISLIHFPAYRASNRFFTFRWCISISRSLIWISAIIQANKHWASVRPDELRKTLRCFQLARKKSAFDTGKSQFYDARNGSKKIEEEERNANVESLYRLCDFTKAEPWTSPFFD